MHLSSGPLSRNATTLSPRKYKELYRGIGLPLCISYICMCSGEGYSLRDFWSIFCPKLCTLVWNYVVSKKSFFPAWKSEIWIFSHLKPILVSKIIYFRLKQDNEFKKYTGLSARSNRSDLSTVAWNTSMMTPYLAQVQVPYLYTILWYSKQMLMGLVVKKFAIKFWDRAHVQFLWTSVNCRLLHRSETNTRLIEVLEGGFQKLSLRMKGSVSLFHFFGQITTASFFWRDPSTFFDS